MVLGERWVVEDVVNDGTPRFPNRVRCRSSHIFFLVVHEGPCVLTAHVVNVMRTLRRVTYEENVDRLSHWELAFLVV